jgi:mannose-6-phosphate isomerase-like protein (cupin superfamily)
MSQQPPKPIHEERPWGEFLEFARNSPCTVKIITVKADEALSLQSHKNRDEFWHIISGEGIVEINKERIPVHAGDEYFIPRKVEHRLEAGTTKLSVLEISFGTFNDEDIKRLEDRYGRT